jgi:hypothetical protein
VVVPSTSDRALNPLVRSVVEPKIKIAAYIQMARQPTVKPM